MVTPDQRHHFHKEGYLVLPNLFSADEMNQTKSSLAGLLTQAQEIGQTEDFPESGYLEHQGARFVLKRSRDKDDSPWQVKTQRIVGCGSVDPDLLATTRSTKLLGVIGDLLDTEELDQIICQFHPKEPGDGVSFKLHRDVANRRHFDPSWKDVSGNGSYVIACIAVDPVTENNGGLVLLPKSNLNYDFESDPDIDNPQITAEEEEELIQPLLSQGSVLLMHPYMLHKSSANRSLQSRYTLLGGYAVPGANSKPYPGGWSVHQRIGIDGKVLVEDLFTK